MCIFLYNYVLIPINDFQCQSVHYSNSFFLESMEKNSDRTNRSDNNHRTNEDNLMDVRIDKPNMIMNAFLGSSITDPVKMRMSRILYKPMTIPIFKTISFSHPLFWLWLYVAMSMLLTIAPCPERQINGCLVTRISLTKGERV